MKTADDPRHLKRFALVQSLFAESFTSKFPTSYEAQLKLIEEALPTIDPLIEKAAPEYPLVKISKVDVAILRLAIFELLFEKETPAKVVIDEAVELGKTFGADSSPSFINGVLGAILKQQTHD